MHKAVFLDRDGVINEDYGYVYEIDRFSVIPGAFEAMRSFQENGFILVVVTNQAGVGRGYYNQKDVVQLHDWINCELNKNGAYIDEFYYSTSFLPLN